MMRELLRGHGDDAGAAYFWEQVLSYVPYSQWDAHAFDNSQ